MTTYFISRHPGAIAWIRAQGVIIDRQVEHLDIGMIRAGDTVIGSLPVNLAEQVCARNARYIHLSLELPEQWRGKELTAQQLTDLGASLEQYAITKVEQSSCQP